MSPKRAGLPRGMELWLALVLLLTGCATLTPLEELTPAPSPPSRGSVRAATKTINPSRPTEKDSFAAHLAFLGAVNEVSGSTRRISSELFRLKASRLGIAGSASGIFTRYLEHGEEQLRWIEANLAAATRLSNAAAEVDEPDMQLALLRLAGPRLESAMLGSLLLTTWLDFLNLTDVAIKQRTYSLERLFVDLGRVQELLQPAMTALSSSDPSLLGAVAEDAPALTGHLTREFAATRDSLRAGAEKIGKLLLLKEALETFTLLSAMRFSLPGSSSTAPVTLGLGLMMGADGVTMGTRIVVSVEWVDLMRQLVQAGVISSSFVSAIVRIQAGQAMLAQAQGELPSSVREALGEGPEVEAVRVTGKAGAGMTEPPRHHVMPREFREWFEQRGFTGEMNIDQFCVEMEQAHHQAIHGGGSWRLGRLWPSEWNQMIMSVLGKAEARAGRMLPPEAILKLVAREMRRYKIPMNFVVGRKR